MTGEVVLVKAKDSVELMQYAGKLKGKIIMQWTAATVKPSFEADGSRFADSVLEKMANAKLQVPAQGQGQGRPQGAPGGGFNTQRRLAELINCRTTGFNTHHESKRK